MFVWHFALVASSLLLFVFSDVESIEVEQPMPKNRRNVHVCRSSEIYNEMMDERIKHMHDEDTVFKLGGKRRFGFYDWFESTQNCSEYQYRPVRLLALPELMKQPPSANITDQLFDKYKALVNEVLHEFEKTISVPYDHLPGAANEPIDKLYASCENVMKSKKTNTPVSIPKHITLDGKNVDMVVAVTYDLNCAGATLASAITCGPYVIDVPANCDSMNPNRTRIIRHRAGVINICPMMEGFDYAYQKDTIRHELLHAMGFLPDPCIIDTNRALFRLRKREHLSYHLDPSTMTVPKLKWSERPVLTFIGPRVLKVARKHYNCSSLDGLPFHDRLMAPHTSLDFNLDANSISGLYSRMTMCRAFSYHWDQYYTNLDIMVPTNVHFLKFSQLTAAYFEDAFMYRINYSMIQHEIDSYFYGRNYGCEFIQKGAMSWIAYNRQIKSSQVTKWNQLNVITDVTKKQALTYCTFPLVPQDVLEYTPKESLTFFKKFSDGGYYETYAVLAFYSIKHPKPKQAEDYFIHAFGKSATDKNISFYVRGVGDLYEFYPAHDVSGSNGDVYGKRPSWCPTTPPQQLTMLNPMSGCVHEGLKGPDYKWCWNEWSQWSDCSKCTVNCTMCTRQRQRIEMCDSLDPSRCVGKATTESGTTDCCLPPTTTTQSTTATSTTSDKGVSDSSGTDIDSSTATPNDTLVHMTNSDEGKITGSSVATPGESDGKTIEEGADGGVTDATSEDTDQKGVVVTVAIAAIIFIFSYRVLNF